MTWKQIIVKRIASVPRDAPLPVYGSDVLASYGHRRRILDFQTIGERVVITASGRGLLDLPLTDESAAEHPIAPVDDR